MGEGWGQGVREVSEAVVQCSLQRKLNTNTAILHSTYVNRRVVSILIKVQQERQQKHRSDKWRKKKTLVCVMNTAATNGEKKNSCLCYNFLLAAVWPKTPVGRVTGLHNRRDVKSTHAHTFFLLGGGGEVGSVGEAMGSHM